MFVNEYRDVWDDHIPYVLMAYRASVQESTGCTPNLLFLGRELSLPIDLMFGQPPVKTLPGCPIAYVEWVKQATQSAFELARNNLKDSAVRQEKLYNCHSDIKPLNPGDWVWRWYPPKAREKLGKGWTGHYLVVKKLTDITYQIQKNEALNLLMYTQII